MSKIEEWAKENKARFLVLDTFDFQAKEFYEKSGYEVEFIRKGYQNGHKLYKMRKEL